MRGSWLAIGVWLLVFAVLGLPGDLFGNRAECSTGGRSADAAQIGGSGPGWFLG